MAGPTNPVEASFPIAPPILNLPVAQTVDGKPVYWTPQGMQFIQQMFAAIQGNGGILDLVSKPGDFKAIGGTTIPSGWLLCNGAAVSRTQYPELFRAIDTTWGAGDGSTTFNLPDARGRDLLGAGGAFSPGDIGGAASITLSTPQLPAHSHPVVDPTHTHPFTGDPHTHTITDPTHSHATNVPASNVTTGADPGGSVVGITGNSATGITIDSATATGTNAAAATGVTVGDTGAGAAISVRNPYAAAYLLIKT